MSRWSLRTWEANALMTGILGMNSLFGFEEFIELSQELAINSRRAVRLWEAGEEYACPSLQDCSQYCVQ